MSSSSQAGPLPPKRGEIGYQEDVHGPSQQASTSRDALQSLPTLPERHPADRPYAGSPARTPSSASSTSNLNERPPSPSSSESAAVSTGKHSFISFLAPKNVPTFGGLRSATLAKFVLQLALIAGTIVAWVLIVRHMDSGASSTPAEKFNDNKGAPAAFNSSSASVFVDVAFIFAVLLQFIFSERTIFRLRAERYCHVHPGEVLPTAIVRRHAQGRFGVAFIPWNRVSLPTYASALAQTGARTGDVEDSAIAVPPPPAYGNDNDSTLILSGSRTAGSAATQRMSQVVESPQVQETREVHTDGNRLGQETREVRADRDRPVSYMSHDPVWEEVLDADRARRLEDVLQQIEEGDVTDAARP
ncbi:hypothetical protein BKA93DRAFT_815399 [Sparassis latifolia]